MAKDLFFMHIYLHEVINYVSTARCDWRLSFHLTVLYTRYPQEYCLSNV